MLVTAQRKLEKNSAPRPGADPAPREAAAEAARAAIATLGRRLADHRSSHGC